MNLTVMQDGSEQLNYDNPEIPIYIRRGDLSGFPNRSALCHWHEEVELLMPLRGFLRYNINGSTVTIEEGSAIFVNSRQMHYGLSADGSNCEYLCLAFRSQLLCANEVIQNQFVQPILTSHNLTYLVLHKTVAAHQPLLTALARVDSLYLEHAPGFEMQIIGTLYQLWQELYLLTADKINEAISTDTNVIIQKKMLEYIRTHYHERINVDAIASSGGVCRTKCWQIFKKYLGQTPNEYLNSYRLEKGMHLLRSTRMSITEIAEACGYNSACYFTEMFTRMKGCSPTQYRRK